MSKTYKCTNYGICTEAEKETVFQETDLEEVDGKFICPKCKQELDEIDNGGGHGKLIAIIAAALIVLGGGTAALLLGGKGEAVEQGTTGQDDTNNGNPQPEPTTYNLDWGTYEGEMQGGKPHGIGTVTVTKSYSIDLKNCTSRQVNKGDKLKSAIFKNGKLTQCCIHYANGEVETINIGY